MPLTIQPLQSLIAYCCTRTYYEIDDVLGPIQIWFGTSTPLSSDKPVVFSTKGTIETKKSLWVKGAHDCDNLQLQGNISDISLLSGWSYIEPYWAPNRWPKCIAFPNAYGEYQPAHLYCEFGEDLVRCYHNGGNPIYLIFLSLPNKAWTVFKYTLTTQPSYNKYDYITSSYQMFVDKGTKLGYTNSPLYNFDLSRHAHTLEYLYEDVIPTIKAGLAVATWQKTIYNSDTRKSISKYSSSAVGNVDSFKSYYEATYPEWLTALTELSKQKLDFGELHYRAISKIDGFTNNGLAYLNDLKNIIKEAKSLWSLLKGKVTPKTVSSLFLEYQYGFRLMYSDTKDLIKSLEVACRSGVSATEEFTNGRAFVKQVSTIRYQNRDSAVEKCYQFLRYLDINLSPENIWDLIPFSFVVDWFTGIGTTLDRLNQLDLIRHLDIDAVYDSYIAIMTIQASEIMPSMIGDIEIRRFERYCHWDASFPLIVPSSPSSTSHWLEGAALIIQRLFK